MTGQQPHTKPALPRVTRRRWVAGTAGVTALLAAACGTSTSPGGDAQAGGPIKPEAATLVWMLWGPGPDRNPLYEQVRQRFQAEQPTVKVEMIEPPPGSGTYLSKVAVQVAAGQPLDVIGTSPVWVPDNVGASVVRELGAYLARDRTYRIDDYAKGAVDGATWKGKLYFLTLFGNFNVLYYNKTLFDRAGVKYPEANWDREQVLDAARKLTQQTGDPNTTVYGFNFSRDLNNISPYIWNNGGDSFDRPEDPTKATMSSPASLDALQWLCDLILRHKVAPGEGGAAQPGFTSGRIAFQTQPVNNIGVTARDAQFPWDITLIPRGKAGRQNYAGTLYYGLCSATRAPDASWALLRTLCGPYGHSLFVQSQIGAPILKGMEKEYLALPPPPDNRKAVLDSLPTLRALPKVRGMNDIYADVFTQTLNLAYRGDVTATEAARTIDERAAVLIKQ